MVNVDDELWELKGVFKDATRSDFYELNNGNIAAYVTYSPNDFSVPDFDVLIEYPYDYPNSPPNAWITEPEIETGTGHVWTRDEDGSPKICYIKPDRWSPDYTTYDAAIMIQTWIWAYCNWLESGNWDWEEAPHTPQLSSSNLSLSDLLPF